MPNVVVFRTEVNASDKASFWRDPNSVRTYLEQNHGNIEILHYSDVPRGNVHRCVAVVKFMHANVANQVKQRYNGRPLFGTRLTTTWLNLKQMKELGMVPCDEESRAASPRDKAFPPHEGESSYRHPRDHRYSRHHEVQPLSESKPPGEKGPSYGASPTADGVSSVPSPVWGMATDWKKGSDTPEGAHFLSARCSAPSSWGGGGRGAGGFCKGWSKGPRGRGRLPPTLPKKRTPGNRGKGSLSPGTKSHSKKRLFASSYGSLPPPPLPLPPVLPPPSKRPRRLWLDDSPQEPLHDGSGNIFDRLSPIEALSPPAKVRRHGEEVREGGTGDEAFREQLPAGCVRTPPPAVDAWGGRGFPSRDGNREREVAKEAKEGSGSVTKSVWTPDTSVWSPVQSSADDKSKDDFFSDLSPDHVTKADWPFGDSNHPGTKVDQFPDHKGRAEDPLGVGNTLERFPDNSGAVLEREAVSSYEERTVEDKSSKHNVHRSEVRNREGCRSVGEGGPSKDPSGKVCCQGSMPEQKSVGDRDGSTVREPMPTSVVGIAGDDCTEIMREKCVLQDEQTKALKASIIKEFDFQASMLAQSCKLLVCDNSDQSKVIVASLTNSLMKMAEKLAHKFRQHSDLRQPYN